MNETNYYLVENKDDDYGNNVEEFVQTTKEYADQYYSARLVPDEDVAVLRKYFTLVDFEEEKERSEDRRFYGSIEE